MATSSDLENFQRKLQLSVEGVVDRFSIAALPVQKKGMQCSLDCFNSSNKDDYKQIAKCVQQCQKPFEELHSVTNTEFQGLQRQIQGCQQGCMNSIQPQIDAIQKGLQKPPSEIEQKQMQLTMERCAEKCVVDQGLSKLPEVEKRLLNYIGNLGGA
eukprot:g12435.t1